MDLRRVSIGLLIVFTLAAAEQTPAQDFYSSSGYSALINNLINNHIWNSAMKGYTASSSRNRASSRSSTSAASTPQSIPEYRRYPAVQFKPTGTRLILQEYLDSVSGTAQEKAELKELVSGIFKKYEAAAAAKGYPNDWALAYVSFVGLNSHIYNGSTEKPLLPFEQNIGLRDVVAEYATDNGTFNNVTDRRKQELYEFLVLFGGLTYHLYEKALKDNDQAELKNARLAAAQNLRIVGLQP